MKTSIELRQERAGLLTECRALVDKAEVMTADDSAQYDRLWDKASELLKEAEKIEQLEAVERDLNSRMEEQRGPAPKGEKASFTSRGLKGIDLENREWAPLLKRSTPEAYKGYMRWLQTGELRNLQADIDGSGGFLNAPLQLADTIITAMDDLVFMRQWGTVISVPNADSLGVPNVDVDASDATWTGELLIGAEDAALTFGRRDLTPHPLAKSIRISRDLLKKVPNVENFVMQRLAYRFAIPQENAFLNGTGAGQPLGVFTASALGIPVAQDVSTDNVAAGPTMNGLTEAKYHLKQQYWPRCKWIFHRDIAKLIAKLKDGEGQYIWRESVRAGEPDRLLNIPVYMSEYAPNTIAVGAYVGIIGDFSNYWIADSFSMEFQRLVELYAATNQVGIIGRLSTDGMPVLAEAFIRVTLP